MTSQQIHTTFVHEYYHIHIPRTMYFIGNDRLQLVFAHWSYHETGKLAPNLPNALNKLHLSTDSSIYFYGP